MIPAFIITLREGLEAFLIVAISVAYLEENWPAGAHSGRPARHPRGHRAEPRDGAVADARQQSGALGAVLALIAAALVGSLVVYMWRAGKRMKREIEGQLEPRPRGPDGPRLPA